MCGNHGLLTEEFRAAHHIKHTASVTALVDNVDVLAMFNDGDCRGVHVDLGVVIELCVTFYHVVLDH